MTYTNERLTKITSNKNSSLIRRFSTLATAREYSTTRDNYRNTPVLLGDDNKFWVAAHHKLTAALETAGYELA